MAPIEFIMLKTAQEVKKLVLAAWEPGITPIRLIKKIVPRSFEAPWVYLRIHKGLLMYSYKRGATTTLNCIYLNYRVDFAMSMLTGEVFKVDMAIRGRGEDNWVYYIVKDV